MADSPTTDHDQIELAWTALVDGSGDAVAPLSPEVIGPSGQLPSRFATHEIATACVTTALLAAGELGWARGDPRARVTLDRQQVATAVRSERYFRSDAKGAGASFAPLSRFWPTSDGWIRTHANYPWHRVALLAAIGASDDPASVAAAMAERTASDIEDVVFAAGGIAAAVRTTTEWQDHPQGQAVGREPLISHQVVGPAAARAHPARGLPAAGLRVLDLTRVIAGPVATRLLGALGAEVLRVDPPGRPDMARGSLADSLLGKRSAVVDASTVEGIAVLRDLLDEADVLVCGYRPGALARFGLDPDALAESHPGLVITLLDAWGHSGPWAGRRGFDSVVQGPTGISVGESPDGIEPSALPCQLLDHGTGYLAAAAVLDGVRRQMTEGGTHVRRVSLARTAAWITSTAGTGDVASSPNAAHHGGDDADIAPWLTEVRQAARTVTAVRPPGALAGQPLQWPPVVSGYATDPPRWSPSA